MPFDVFPLSMVDAEDGDMTPAAPSYQTAYPERTPDPSEREFVTRELSEIKADIKHFEKDFKRMARNIRFANGRQWPGQTEEDSRYVMNIVQNVVRRRVASLYARNPTVVARRKPRMDFALWDEDWDGLAGALSNPADPMNAALLQDVMQGLKRRKMLDRTGKTLEHVFRAQVNTADRKFKRQMKRLVRRAELCGVGYVKLDFQRDMEVKPDIEAQIGDLQGRLARVEQLVAENEAGEFGGDEGREEELRQAIEGLERQKYILKSEGLVFRFPNSWDIIPSRFTTQIEGWIGCPRLTERIRMSADKIKAIYGVDVTGMATAAQLTMAGEGMDATPAWSDPADMSMADAGGMHWVYIVQNRETGMQYTICEGCNYYLDPPAPLPVTMEDFYTIRGLMFNDMESMDTIFPQATVDLIWHMQMEMNRAAESKRQHRIASKPLYIAPTGALDDEDTKNIAEHAAHEVLELGNLAEGQPVEQKFQMVKKHPIDPNMYETVSIFGDLVRVLPMGQASLGVTTGATATESGIAEDSYQGDISSNGDDLDDLLAWIVNGGGHCILMNFTGETVRRIAGPGAVWPEFSGDDIMENIYLDIQSGTSGRPNLAKKAAMLERLYPLLIQLQGVKQEWVVRMLVSIIDENVDLAEAYLANIPSIMVANRALMAGPGAGPGGGAAGMPGQVPTGNPATDPGMQGGEGMYNMPGREAPGRGPQETMPLGTRVDTTGRGGL